MVRGLFPLLFVFAAGAVGQPANGVLLKDGQIIDSKNSLDPVGRNLGLYRGGRSFWNSEAAEFIHTRMTNLAARIRRHRLENPDVGAEVDVALLRGTGDPAGEVRPPDLTLFSRPGTEVPFRIDHILEGELS